MPPTPTPTPNALANASSGLTDGFAAMTGLTGALGAVAMAIVVLLVVSYGVSSLERYERLRWLAGRIARVFVLAAYGLGGVFVLGIVTAPAYYVASQPAATRTEWLTYAGYGLAVLLGLAAFGWVVEHVVEMAKARHAELREQETPTETTPEASD